jgi:hypothetical protein
MVNTTKHFFELADGLGRSQDDGPLLYFIFFQVTFIKDLQYKECKNMPRLMPVELFSPIEEVHYKKVIS